MAKPIVVITFPTSETQERYYELRAELSEKLYDYHVFILKGDVEFPTVKVFHEKDFTEIEYGELTQLILETQTNV